MVGTGKGGKLEVLIKGSSAFFEAMKHHRYHLQKEGNVLFIIVEEGNGKHLIDGANRRRGGF